LDRAERKLWRRIPTLGMLSMASFAICAISGLMLIPLYTSSAPLDSLVLLSLKNQVGVYIRSLHFWSAQIFLASTLAHIVDHLLRRSEMRLRFGVWLRLSLAIPVLVAAMLSGFLLRADAAAMQALPVLRNLLAAFPVVGTGLRVLLTGSGADLSTIYLHHACTATLILLLVTIEHSRQIVPTGRSLLSVALPASLISLLLVPGLEWRTSAVEKGPWYLVGLQEMLHWLPRPQIVVWGGILVLALLISLPKLPERFQKPARWALTSAALSYVVLTGLGLGFRGDGWRWTSPRTVLASEIDLVSYRAYIPPNSALLKGRVPLVDGRREGCLSCHADMTGFVPAHDPGAIGCASCHLGNPWTLDKKLAHSGMTLTPGNLSLANQTCGASNCHADQANRVRASLMNTMSGVVAVDRYVFGENSDLNAHFAVSALGHSPADSHLRNLCASCHLGHDKIHPGPINETDRGGGCSACHLSYGAEAALELRKTATLGAPLHHPDISIRIPNEACYGCHSRSGRISTSYEGWHETLLDERVAKSSPGWPAGFRVLADGRVFEKHTADVHAEKGMVCVDCHVAAEIMGDGTSHAHENNAIKIACADCHGQGKARSAKYTELDPETQQIVAMRKLNKSGRRFIAVAAGGAAYPNVFDETGGRRTAFLANSGTTLESKTIAPVCEAGMHRRLTCTACHTAWAPQCITCHTSFDPKSEGWDHLANRYVNGTWNEDSAGYLSDAPALGIELTKDPNGSITERVTTFVPGMILDIVGPRSSESKRQFHRLFAPASAHTINTHARDCRSCHLNPAALGYGRGQLKYAVAGHAAEWKFVPEYAAAPQDALPSDAWIGFLREPPSDVSTRTGARPFNLDEQRRILIVGACLSCHTERERRIANVFADFRNYRSKLSPRCVLPGFAREEVSQ
jgi:hypothetical protein